MVPRITHVQEIRAFDLKCPLLVCLCRPLAHTVDNCDIVIAGRVLLA